MTEQECTTERFDLHADDSSSWQDQLTDNAIAYAIQGYMPREEATGLLNRPLEERAFMAERLEDLCDQDIRLNSGHLRWMSSVLRREELTVHAVRIFTDTVALMPGRDFKQGLSSRAYSGGRHSSPFTSGW